MLTMQEIEPLAMCIATQQLLDRRFRSSFGDNIILRDRDRELEPWLLKIKREMNIAQTEMKYLEGHKMNIINNIDKILILATRFARVDMRMTENVIKNGKDIIRNVILAESFDQIGQLESAFKSQITLPVYELYVKQMKETQTRKMR